MIGNKAMYDQFFKAIDLNKTIRNAALKSAEKALWVWNVEKNITGKPKEIQKLKFYEGSSILYSLLRNYDRKYISKKFLKGYMKRFIKALSYHPETPIKKL